MATPLYVVGRTPAVWRKANLCGLPIPGPDTILLHHNDMISGDRPIMAWIDYPLAEQLGEIARKRNGGKCPECGDVVDVDSLPAWRADVALVVLAVASLMLAAFAAGVMWRTGW